MTSGDTSLGAEVGCIDAGAAGLDQTADVSVGECPGGANQDAVGVSGSSGDTTVDGVSGSSGDTTVDARVGCIDGAGGALDARAAATLGSCAAGGDDAASLAVATALAGGIDCLAGALTTEDVFSGAALGSCPANDSSGNSSQRRSTLRAATPRSRLTSAALRGRSRATPCSRMPCSARARRAEESGAANVAISSGDPSAAGEVGCIDAGAVSGDTSGAASVGSCRSGTTGQPAVDATASSGGTNAGATVGCIDAGAASDDTSARGSVGSCLEGSDGQDAAGVEVSTGDTSAGANVGCVDVSVSSSDTSAAASVGFCPAAADPGTSAAGMNAGADSEEDDGGVADAFASGGSNDGVLDQLARGTLPFTGFPLWTVGLIGAVALLFGIVLYRRRRKGITQPTA